ncbi:phosphatidate phosphatase APP1 [Podospora conica]|nr:phosphatidate phosphatase APP1 [Schizothecium conicum]
MSLLFYLFTGDICDLRKRYSTLLTIFDSDRDTTMSNPRLRYSTSDITSLESRTRSDHGFEEAENSLLKHAKVTSKASKLQDILSYLGPRNPLPVQVTKKDAVWLLDNVAFRSTGGHWHAEFVSAVFETKTSARLVDYVGDVASIVKISKGDAEEAVIEERIVPFVMDIQPGRQVKVDFGGTKIKLGPGGRNGISSDLKRVPDPPKGEVMAVAEADVPAGATGILHMKTFYAEPEGWAVLSDVDDTIKVTMTSDPAGILRSTFVSKPTPVAGMPELYAYLATLVGHTAPWFYLSASPYNLYPFLSEFRDQHYPHGQLILRDSSWMTISGLLSNLTLGTEQYKIDRVKKVHRWLPKRKMILIGDSTQSDPEAYGAAFRAFPGWIKLILIRKVVDIAAVGIEEKNEAKRFEDAFEGVPRDMWHVFESPSECPELLHKVIAGSK